MAKTGPDKFHSVARLIAGLITELVEEHDREVQALTAEKEKLFLAATAAETWALENPAGDGTSCGPVSSLQHGPSEEDVVKGSWSFSSDNWKLGLPSVGAVGEGAQCPPPPPYDKSPASPSNKEVLQNLPNNLPGMLAGLPSDTGLLSSPNMLTLNDSSGPLPSNKMPSGNSRRASYCSSLNSGTDASLDKVQSITSKSPGFNLGNLRDNRGADRQRQRRRFQRIFNLNPDNPEEVLDAETLYHVLETRATDGVITLSPDRLTEVLLELRGLGKSINLVTGKKRTSVPHRSSLFSFVMPRVSNGHEAPQGYTIDFGTMEFGSFVELMLIDHLPALVRSQISAEVRSIQFSLMALDINDVLVKAGIQAPEQTAAKFFKFPSFSLLARGKASSFFRSGTTGKMRRKSKRSRSKMLLLILNMVVSFTVIASILCLGVSMDHDPKGIGWFVVECACAIIFVIEFVIKCSISGWREYFCGSAMIWNWCDIFLTVLAIIDIVLTMLKTISITRLGLSLRSVRLFRLARLLKMLNSPILSDLSNMLSGVVVGAPALFWVSVMLSIVTYIIALGFRVTTAPDFGVSVIEMCGFVGDDYSIFCGDHVANNTRMPECDGNCQPFYLYGEEFFGTMPKSLFTVFRCMTWDCATKSGQSLTVHFSAGFGWQFDVLYFVAVIFLSFGLFNVITAVFVETTSTGLKHNATMKKFTAKYEADYTRQKMHKLIRMIFSILGENPNAHVDRIRISEEKFYDIFKDEKVIKAFEDLDIHGLSRHGRIFDLFDPDGRGEVGLPQFISTLFMMRGELHKTDIIANWVALRGMNSKMISLQSMLIAAETKADHGSHSRHLARRLTPVPRRQSLGMQYEMPPIPAENNKEEEEEDSNDDVVPCEMPEVPTAEDDSDNEVASNSNLDPITSVSLF